MYLLELGSLKFTLITTSHDEVHLWLDHVVFAPGTSAFGPDWQHLVAVWSSDDEPRHYDVHDRLGQHVAHFAQQEESSVGSVPAFAMAGRVAVASRSRLVVWNLLSGQHLGTRRHPAHGSDLMDESDDDWEGDGVVAANSMGSKLAFVAAQACDIHLYDTLTLLKIGCVRAHAGRHAPSAFSFASSLEYGVYGWTLLHLDPERTARTCVFSIWPVRQQMHFVAQGPEQADAQVGSKPRWRIPGFLAERGYHPLRR